MAKGLEQLKESLLKNPAARAKFLSDYLDLLRRNGVDVDNADVLKDLGIDFDLKDGKKFLEGLNASTNIITIVL